MVACHDSYVPFQVPQQCDFELMLQICNSNIFLYVQCLDQCSPNYGPLHSGKGIPSLSFLFCATTSYFSSDCVKSLCQAAATTAHCPNRFLTTIDHTIINVLIFKVPFNCFIATNEQQLIFFCYSLE